MNEKESTFLFTIAKEIKQSYETPVIMLTNVDYGRDIYNLSFRMHQVLVLGADTQGVMEVINIHHSEWLQTVRSCKALQQRITTLPRNVVYDAINYTVKCVEDLVTHFKKYTTSMKTNLTNNEINLMQTDIELIEEMQKSVIIALKCKYVSLQSSADGTEFRTKVEFELQELLNWWDRLNDSLSKRFCHALDLDYPFLYNLTKTLKRIVNSIKASRDQGTIDFLKTIESKGEVLSSMMRTDASHELEIEKVLERIQILDDRIQRLQSGSSAAVMALQHKRIYLVERLRSLENLKQGIQKLQNTSDISIMSKLTTDDMHKEFHIFNHLLPDEKCIELVTELGVLWEAAVNTNCNRKSVITILSVGDIKEEYSDYLGVFTHDKYGRKIYEKTGCNNLYQTNERNELVPVSDDDKHVYFYDAIGRYYLDQSLRIYKANAKASEYVLNLDGMVKLKEVVDGVDYCFDNLGRYYLNVNKQRIYRSANSDIEYQNDGFGNLISIDSYRAITFARECPPTPIITDSAKYLQKTVGDALTKCLANLILRLPADPIRFLADSLEKYKKDTVFMEQHEKDEQELFEQRVFAKEDNLGGTSSSISHGAYSLQTTEEQSNSSYF